MVSSHVPHIVNKTQMRTKAYKTAAVICVLHGISIGIAIDISSCADVRICARNTRFAVKEVDIGLAADLGTLSRLPKLVGSTSWVKDVCLSARDFLAEEALSVGFVSQIHETKAAAVDAGLRLAGFIAGKSPVAVQGTKELLNHARDHSVAESMLHSIWSCFSTRPRYSSVLTDSLRSAVHHRLELGHAAIE